MKQELIPVALSWSGGKDSALTLQALRESNIYDVRVLLTTITQKYDRISVHGVRRVLLEQQARALGLPLETALIPPKCSNDDYERNFGETLSRCKEQGIDTFAAGDLFLEDVRVYREKFAARRGFNAIFPIWGRDTTTVAHNFIEEGYKAILTCVDTEAIDGNFAGRHFDASLLRDLPQSADPCGENGEFHTFVWDGPLFSEPIHYEKGEFVLRDERFMFCDLRPE